MSRILITFACAPGDVDAVVTALRDGAAPPVHVSADRVHGSDFSDARTVEQVGGALDRRSISLVADEAALDAIIARATGARRRQPIRWHVVPVLAEGRAP